MENKHKQDLSKYKIVYCDDYNALMWAFKNKLPQDAIIKTYSAKIYYSHLKNVKKMSKSLKVEENIQLVNLFKKYLNDIHNILKKNFSNELSLFLLHKFYLYKRVIEKISDLDLEDFKEDVLFIKITGSSGPNSSLYIDNDNVFNPPWEAILKNTNNFNVIEYNISKNYGQSKANYNFNIFKRLKMAGIESIGYRIFIKLTKFITHFFSKQILVLHENELIIETCYWMFLKGYSISQFNHFDNFHSNDDDDPKELEINIKKLETLTDEITSQYFETLLNKKFIKNTKQLLHHHLAKNIILYNKYLDFYDKNIKKLNKKTIIFTSAPFSTRYNGAALLNAANKYHLPLVVFQHGVGPEIEDLDKGDMLPHESRLSNIYVAFNKNSKQIADKYNKSNNNIIGGISSRHLRSKKKNYLSKKSIIYISTYLPKGNFGRDSSFYSDIDNIYYELKIIKNVFSKFRNNFLYKSYPITNFRYADGDPLINELQKNKIKYFNKNIDMRYMIDKFNIFITKDATSTLAWPLLSGKPVIFINSLRRSIDEKIKPLFKESIFYFEEDENEISNKLYNLLSLEFKEILEIYKKKSEKRKELINSYFTSNLSYSGKRTMSKLLELEL